MGWGVIKYAFLLGEGGNGWFCLCSASFCGWGSGILQLWGSLSAPTLPVAACISVYQAAPTFCAMNPILFNGCPRLALPWVQVCLCLQGESGRVYLQQLILPIPGFHQQEQVGGRFLRSISYPHAPTLVSVLCRVPGTVGREGLPHVIIATSRALREKSYCQVVHVEGSCVGTMCRDHMEGAGGGTMCRDHVEGAGGGIMWRDHVETMWRNLEGYLEGIWRGIGEAV